MVVYLVWCILWLWSFLKIHVRKMRKVLAYTLSVLHTHSFSSQRASQAARSTSLYLGQFNRAKLKDCLNQVVQFFWGFNSINQMLFQYSSTDYSHIMSHYSLGNSFMDNLRGILFNGILTLRWFGRWNDACNVDERPGTATGCCRCGAMMLYRSTFAKASPKRSC